MEFAPRAQREFDLLEFIKKKLGGRVSVERVVSGRGIVLVYEFLYHRLTQECAAANTPVPPGHTEVYDEVMASCCFFVCVFPPPVSISFLFSSVSEGLWDAPFFTAKIYVTTAMTSRGTWWYPFFSFFFAPPCLALFY